jgi:hypothetical protein
MKPTPRPAVESVVPHLAVLPPSPPKPTPPSARPDAADTPNSAVTEQQEEELRYFYGWCAGCEGYGSIF